MINIRQVPAVTEAAPKNKFKNLENFPKNKTKDTLALEKLHIDLI